MYKKAETPNPHNIKTPNMFASGKAGLTQTLYMPKTDNIVKTLEHEKMSIKTPECRVRIKKASEKVFVLCLV